ncbi:MAG: hypothetical protein IKB34_03755, partial [Clostridia bacterium]|nr:hypothetical protein [Clostridia bacterium]
NIFQYKIKCFSPEGRKATLNQGEALYEIRNLSAVWNHHGVMYGINPKEKCTLMRDAIRLRRLHTRLRRDSIPILRIG